MKKNDIIQALVSISRGNTKAFKRMPKWFVTILLSMVVRGEQRRKMEMLLPTVLCEHKAGECLDSAISTYQSIDADVLLVSGEKSPDWVHQVIPELNKTIKQTKMLKIPKFNHLSPNNKNASEVGRHVKRFILE